MTTYPAHVIPDRVAELGAIELLKGVHAPDHQFCVMEAVAYVAGEKHSDHPQCTSKVLGAFLRPINDWMADAERQQLKPYVVRLAGTRGTVEQEQRRAFMLADWAIHFAAPFALRAAGSGEQATKLEALPAVVGEPSAYAARDAAKAAADAARDAAKAAADAAAYAARGAAYAAAYAAADAARGAAYAAAYAAYAAAYAAADAARDAAKAAADAARDAAKAAAYAAAKAAAYAAARATIIENALQLLERLIAVTETVPA